MEKPNVFLSVLPDDDVSREIVGYGPVRRAPSGASEIEIRVHWAQPRADGRFGEGCTMLSRWVGCGKLAFVPVGSRWRRRMKVEMPPPFVPLSTATVVCVGMETIGRSVVGRKLDYYPFDVDPDTRCFRLELDGDRRKVALVPVLEVIRAVFGCRSGFLRQIFDGQRDPALMRRRFLFDRAKSGMKGRIVDIHGHSKPTEREAWLAAMMVASGTFRMSHDGVFANIQVAGGLGGGAERFIETSFPFLPNEPIGLAFESRLVEIEPGSQTRVSSNGASAPLHRPTTTRQLITRICAIESLSPFDMVTYSWPRFGTAPGLPPSESRTLFSGKRSIVLVDTVAPGTLRGTMTLGVEGAEALAMTGVVFTARARLVGKKGRSKSLVDDAKGELQGSTADAHGQGDDDVAPVDFEVRDPNGNPGAALGAHGRSIVATDMAIHHLLAANATWMADGLSDDPGSKPPLWPVSIGNVVLHLVEVELSTSDGHMLIYEAGSVAGNKRSLGFVVRDDKGAFTDSDLEIVRHQIVIWKAHWHGGRSLPGFVVKGLSRKEAFWSDIPLYASKIAEVVKLMIG